MCSATGGTGAGAGRQNAVLTAQIDYLYQQLPRVLGYTLLAAGMVAFMLRGVVPDGHVLGWLATMLLATVLRAALYYRYRRSDPGVPIERWARRFSVYAAVSGIIWGSAGIVLFAPEHLELQALILLVLAGMGAGSAAVLPMHLPAFYAYFPVSMLPIGAVMFAEGDRFHLIMGLFDLVFTIGVLTFGRAIGNAFRSSLDLRYENISLVRSLQQQKEAAERANRAKSKFLAAASHDLRQPMHALTLFSEVLEQKTDDPETRTLVESIRTSVNALTRLFDALLDISRLDAGVLSPEIRVFPLQEVLDRVANDYRPHAQERGLEFSCEPCPCLTESDPVLLERILRNLVSNAVRYTASGRVDISCMQTPDDLSVSVVDTGVGIAPGDQDIIYQEFVQLGNPERDRTKGLGLGLSIVKRLAELLGHRLELESDRNSGTSFTLRLPQRGVATAEYGTACSAAPNATPTLDKRVLVIDDDAEARAGLRALLESWGCTVMTASSLPSALEAITGTASLPDAVIADFRLPENRTGTEAVARIRQEYDPAMPALLISGDTEAARLQEAREGGLQLLHKPVAPAQLRAWLTKVTRR